MKQTHRGTYILAALALAVCSYAVRATTPSPPIVQQSSLAPIAPYPSVGPGTQDGNRRPMSVRPQIALQSLRASADH